MINGLQEFERLINSNRKIAKLWDWFYTTLEMFLTYDSCSSAAYLIYSQISFFLFVCPGLTRTSLDVSGTGEIFIGTISLERCCTEQRKCHCWCDVFKFLSTVTVSTGALGVVFYRRLRAKFLLSLCARNRHSTQATQADAAESTSWRENVCNPSLALMLTPVWFVNDDCSAGISYQALLCCRWWQS